MSSLILISSFLAFSLSSVVNAKERDCREILKEVFYPSLKEKIRRNVLDSKLMYSSGKVLASRPGFEIEGFVKNAHLYKEAAQVLAEKIHSFDQHIKNLGFSIPKSTRLIISENNLITVPSYGLFFRRLIWNWRKGFQAVIFVNASKSRTDGPLPVIQKDHVVFLHERVHSLLLHTYGSNAFISSFITPNEALADFLTAHELGNLIKYKSKGRTIVTRDIEKKIFIIRGKQHDFGIHPYTDSIYYSNALWETRKVLGAAVLSSFIKDFVDNLDLYRDSFVTLKQWDSKEGLYEGRAKDELEYFLAVLRRTIADTGSVEDLSKIDRVIVKIADDRELRLGRLYSASGAIFKRKNSLHQYDRDLAMKHAILYSTDTILKHEAAFVLLPIKLYWIYLWIFEDSD